MLSFFAIASPDELRYVQAALRGGIDKIFENSADGKWQFSMGGLRWTPHSWVRLGEPWVILGVRGKSGDKTLGDIG